MYRSHKCKKTDNLTVFFALLGSAHLKADLRMLMKLTPANGDDRKSSQIIVTVCADLVSKNWPDETKPNMKKKKHCENFTHLNCQFKLYQLITMEF
jgi:hypothetical protein